MLACGSWLAEDFLLRTGFTIVHTAGGRFAVRGERRYDLGPVCGHRDCPPHETLAVRELGVAA